MKPATQPAPLSWFRSDPECRLGLRGARFTRVNSTISAVTGLLLAALFLGALKLLPSTLSNITDIFFKRSLTQYVTVFATTWCIAILVIKSRKLSLQRKALKYVVVPEQNDFVLSTATVDDVSDRIYATADDPRHFVLFNRILVALSNLRNLGRVTDVDEILRSQGDRDEAIMEGSYSLVRGLIWAIPVLGFIGTVVGLSVAINEFGAVLSSANEISEITGKLKNVTAGLSTAFDTTFVALVAALFLQIVVTFLYKEEQEFLDSCSEYCQRHIVNRLRIMPFHSDDT